MNKITQDRVRELLSYDPETGFVRWKKTTSPRARTDIHAGSLNISFGYRRIRIDNKLYLLHRIIWLFYYGYFPENNIDHIDRNPLNNKINNLREVSRSCNVRNSGNPSDNTSGVKGVCFHITVKLWVARINKVYLGYFKNFEDAVLARYKKEKELNWNRCDSSSPAYKYLKDKGMLPI